MKTIDETIKGVTYTFKELPAAEGIPLLFTDEGKMDNLRFTQGTVCIKETGEPIKPETINTGLMVKLINRALRINGLADAVEGEAEAGGN